jgi:hypothetical protein
MEPGRAGTEVRLLGHFDQPVDRDHPTVDGRRVGVRDGTRRWPAAVQLGLVVVLGLATSGLVRTGRAATVADPAAVRAACPAVRPDEAAALMAARACGGRVEVASRLTERSRAWAEASGSISLESTLEPERIKDNAGRWVPVDTTLVVRPDGSVAPKAHPHGLVLAGAVGAGDHDLATVRIGGEAVTLGWLGPLPVPVLQGSTATYEAVMPGVDLVVEATRTSFNYALVVRDRPAAANLNRIAMPWRTGRLTTVASADGGLELRDLAGRPAARVPAAQMWDSTVEKVSGEHLRRTPVGLAVVPRTTVESSTADLVLTPSRAFLDDPATVYPVSIDPGPIDYNPSFDAFVQSNFVSDQSGSTELRIGTYDSGGTVARSYLTFWLGGLLHGATVQTAYLFLWNFHSWSCQQHSWQVYWSSYVDSSVRWNNQPGNLAWVNQSSQTLGNTGCGANWVWTDTASGVQRHADDPNSNTVSFRLSAASETNNLYWKKFHSAQGAHQPILRITYNMKPTVSAVSTVPSIPCATGTSRPHVSTVPQLQAQVGDAENDTVSARFEWSVVNGAPIGSTTTATAAAGSTLATSIPAADLADGGTYSWRAQGFDGVSWGPWSNSCEFTVDAQAPAATFTTPPTACIATGTAADTASLPRLNPGASGLTLNATVNDINGGTTQAQFEWWRKADRGVAGASPLGSSTTSPPAAVGSTFQTIVVAGTFTDGQAYAWHARGSDGGFAKPWSPWCEFVVDSTPPGAPSVTAGPGNNLTLAVAPAVPGVPSATAMVGRPTSVSFHPAGGTDSSVVGYLWDVSSSGGSPTRWAPADSTGNAVVSVEPVASGLLVNRLTVLAVDRAGNRSILPGAGYSYGFKANAAAGWWPTDGTGGPVADMTAAGNDLTLATGAAPGHGVLSLNGSTGQAAAPAPVLDTTGSWTVAAWARPTTLSGDRTVVSQDGISTSGFRLGFDATANRWCFSLPDGDTTTPTVVSVCTATAPSTGVWTHLVGVYDASAHTISLNVDGTPVGSTGFTTPWSADGAFVVGRALVNGAQAAWFAGDVADVRAWSAVLDAAGITALAALPPAAGRWGMDDPSAAVAPDTSGLATTHALTVTGGGGWASGHAGSGLTLDGVSGTATTTGAVIATDQSFSVSAWVNTSDPSTTTVRTAITQRGSTRGAFFLAKQGNRWVFSRPTGASSSTVVSVASTVVLTPNTWVHLVGVYDAGAGQIKLYVNGSLDASTACPCSWTSTGGLQVGRTLWPDPQTELPWQGGVDDVRVFQGILSGAQIARLTAA